MAVKQLLQKGKLPRIAIVSDAHYPQHTTNTQQVIKNASALVNAGLPVELVIPLTKKYYFKKIDRIQADIYAYYNIPPNLPVKGIRTLPATRFRLEKFSHMIASVIFSWLKDYDLIYTRNETLAVFCLLTGKPFIFETYRRFGHEFPKGMAFLAKRAKNRALFSMVLHSELAAQSMEKAGIDREKLLVLHNGFDIADMEPRLTKMEARMRLGMNETDKIVVYTGNMQEGKGIESLIDLAAEVPEAKFCLVGGTGEDLNRLGNYAVQKNTYNVQFPGWQPISEVSKYLYCADVLIIPCTAAPLMQHGKTVLPFKIFPYLASGRPIIAANTPDITEILHHQENAYLVEPDNPTATAQGLKDLLSDTALLDKLSKNALETSRQLTWEHRAARFKKWLEAKLEIT